LDSNQQTSDSIDYEEDASCRIDDDAEEIGKAQEKRELDYFEWVHENSE
jgi:hypothetical protein